MQADKVAIVVPAFNEQQVIGDVIAGLKRLDGLNAMVVVVDDGSEDQTADVAKKAGAIVLRHLLNLGQGASLRTGIEYALQAGASRIVTFDADGQHKAEDVFTLLGPLDDDQCDVVLGSRFLEGSDSSIPQSRRTLLRLAVVFTRVFSRIKVSDAHNGMRAFSRKAAQAIRIQQPRMAHASEILHEIARTKLRYREVPVTVRYTEYSISKGQRFMDAISILADLIIRRIGG